ncbi:MAG: GAF domain-containing protein, partial [bacterium]|nr:GAF domain-containing protein [bacterium]
MTQEIEVERETEDIDPKEYAKLKLVYDITKQFQGTLNIKVLMNKILTKILDELKAEAGTFFMVDEKVNEIVCTEALGPARDKVLDLRIPMGAGVVGWCIKTRKPTIIYDTSKDKRFHFDVDQQTGFVTKSVICVPIVHQKHALGAVELFNKRTGDGKFDDRDMDILKIIADNAAAILNNTKIHEMETKLRERSMIMNEFARVFNETLDLDSLLGTVFTNTVTAFKCEAGSIWLLDGDDESKIVCRVADGPGKNQILGAKLPVGTGIVGTVVLNKKMEMVFDAEKDERFMSAVDEKTGFKTVSMLCVPLMDGSKCIGCIQVINKKSGNRKFGRDDVDLLRGVAAIAAVSIKNAQVYENECKIHELSGLLQISRDINASLDFDSVAVSVVNLTSRLIEYDRAVLLAEVKPGKLTIAAVSGMAGNFKIDPALSHLESISSLILENKDENYYPDVEQYINSPTAVEQFKKYFEMAEIKSFYCRKIADGEGLIGILIFESKSVNVVPEEKREMLDILWNQVAVSLRNAQLYRSVPKFDLFRSKKGKSYKWPIVLSVLAVVTAALYFMPVRYTVSADSEVVPRDKRFVYSEVDGLLKEMLIHDGDMVDKGQPIARIDDRELVFQRNKLKNKTGIIEQEILRYRMENNLIELTNKQNELKQIRSQIEDLGEKIEHTEIISPLTGQIILKDASSKQGEFISRGSKLGEV